MRAGQAPAGTDMELLDKVQSTSTCLAILMGLMASLFLGVDVGEWPMVFLAAIFLYPVWMIGNCLAVKKLLISKGRFNLDG